MEGIVLLMVTLAPWCYGAVDPIFEYGLFVGVGLLAALWGIRSVIDGKFVWFSCPVTLSLGFIFLIGVIQLVPMPSWILSITSPAAASVRSELLPAQSEIVIAGKAAESEPGWPTISIYSVATRQFLIRMLAVFVLFAVVRVNVASTASLKRLAWVVMANGVALSLFGIGQFVQNRSNQELLQRSVFGYQTRSDVFGPFICRNHFAYYANICIGFTISLLLLGSRTESDRRARKTYKSAALEEQTADEEATLSILGILHSPLQLWLSVAIAAIIAGLLCSMSRGGVVALVIGIAITFALRGFTGRRIKRLDLAIIPILLMVALVGWLGVKPLESRLNPFSSDLATEGRLSIWSNLLPLTWRYPIFGTGYGTLQYVEPLYREKDYGGYNADVYVDHAHNDYLEAMVEGGIPRLVLTVAIVYFLLRYGRQALKRHEIRTPGRLAFGAMIGISAVAAHSLVDFGMFTPAVTVLVVVTAAQLCNAARSDPSTPPTDRSKHSITIASGLVPSVAALVVFVAIALVLIGFGSRQAKVHAARIQAFNALKKSKDPDLARASLIRAVGISPDDAELRAELGQVYIDARQAGFTKIDDRTRFAAASSVFVASSFPLNCLLPITQIEPPSRDRPPVFDELAQRGVEQMIVARNLCPFLARSHARLAAWAFDANGGKAGMAKSDPAENYWNRAIRLAPYDVDLLYFAGQFQLRQNKTEVAWDLWRRSLALQPKHLRDIVTAALPRIGGDGVLTRILPDDAGQIIDTANIMASQPHDASIRRKLLSKAKDLLANVTDNAVSAYQLAKCCQALGENEAARKNYERAVDLFPRRIEWRYDFAKFLHSLDTDSSRREALTECERIIEIYPGWGPAINLQNQLRSELNIVR